MKRFLLLVAFATPIGSYSTAQAAEQHTLAAVGIAKLDQLADGSLAIDAANLVWIRSGAIMGQAPRRKITIIGSNPNLNCLALAAPAVTSEVTFVIETRQNVEPEWNRRVDFILDAFEVQACRLQRRGI